MLKALHELKGLHEAFPARYGAVIGKDMGPASAQDLDHGLGKQVASWRLIPDDRHISKKYHPFGRQVRGEPKACKTERHGPRGMSVNYGHTFRVTPVNSEMEWKLGRRPAFAFKHIARIIRHYDFIG